MQLQVLKMAGIKLPKFLVMSGPKTGRVAGGTFLTAVGILISGLHPVHQAAIHGTRGFCQVVSDASINCAVNPPDALTARESNTLIGMPIGGLLTTVTCAGSDDTVALAAASALGGTAVIQSGQTCAVNNLTLSGALWIQNGGLLKPNTGQNVALSGPPIGGPYQMFTNALPGQGTVSFSENGAVTKVRPEWWGANTAQGTTDMTSALVAAEASLPSSGGILSLQPTTYLITSWTPIRASMVVQGAGQGATIIKGSGAGAYTVRFNNLGRTHWNSLTIDGGEVKQAAMIMIGSSGVNVFENVRWKGGTTNTLVIGVVGSGSDDIADNTWIGCTIQSDNCSGAQLKYRGNNVSSNIMTGGRISTGGSNIPGMMALEMDDGATLRLYGVNLLGDSATGTYVAVKASGVLQMIGGHVEGNGFLHTLSTDPRTDESTPPDLIEAVTLATSGANSIYHEARRTMLVTGTRGGGNIRIGNAARLIGKGNSFPSGSSYLMEGNAELVADDAAKGSQVLAENSRLADTFLSSLASDPEKILGLWFFDEDGSATTVTDRGPRARTMTLSHAANSLSPRNRGLAPSLLFSNSPSHYWSIRDSGDFSFANQTTDAAFTFIVLMTPLNLTSNTLIGKYNGAAGTGEYLFAINKGKLLLILFDQSTGGLIQRSYDTALTDRESAHVYAATYDGSRKSGGVKLYRDGVRVDDTTATTRGYVAMRKTPDLVGNFTFAPGRVVGDARMFACAIVKEEWTATQILRATRLLQAHAALF